MCHFWIPCRRHVAIGCCCCDPCFWTTVQRFSYIYEYSPIPELQKTCTKPFKIFLVAHCAKARLQITFGSGNCKKLCPIEVRMDDRAADFATLFSLGCRPGELSFAKIAESQKNQNNCKKWSENWPWGNGTNQLGDPVCGRICGLAAPSDQIYIFAAPWCKKGSLWTLGNQNERLVRKKMCALIPSERGAFL